MFDLNNSYPTTKEINEALAFDKEYQTKFGTSIFDIRIGSCLNIVNYEDCIQDLLML